MNDSVDIFVARGDLKIFLKHTSSIPGSGYLSRVLQDLDMSAMYYFNSNAALFHQERKTANMSSVCFSAVLYNNQITSFALPQQHPMMCSQMKSTSLKTIKKFKIIGPLLKFTSNLTLFITDL